MINFRLLSLVPETKLTIALTVFFQWLGLLFSMVFMINISYLVDMLLIAEQAPNYVIHILVFIAAILGKMFASYGRDRMAMASAMRAKAVMRKKLYGKILDLGPGLAKVSSSAESTQLVSEGVDQLEIYFAQYIPQFFYALLAPLTLFFVLAFYSIKVSIVLLLFVPLIPVSIIVVQKFAKRLLKRYWGMYTGLGETFLENLHGLTALKGFNADQYMADKMDRDAESFRKATMRVLIMQLNSISVMDWVAYGGAALSIWVAFTQVYVGAISTGVFVLFILLSSEFFIPMRQLGSFFHIAMNGAAAADKMFKILDEPLQTYATQDTILRHNLTVRHLDFAYNETNVLEDISLTIPEGAFISLVGDSGSGKSTMLSLLAGMLATAGNIMLGDVSLESIPKVQLSQIITHVSQKSYVFEGTFRSNLAMSGCDDETRMNEVLKQLNLDAFLAKQNGLDTPIMERGSNLSGGQKQRLVLARAMLHDTPIYLFDEVTSNIDKESESQIMEAIQQLSNHGKTVIVVSHRLANVVKSDKIYVFRQGILVEQGTHNELLAIQGHYHKLYQTQASLESFAFLGGEQ